MTATVQAGQDLPANAAVLDALGRADDRHCRRMKYDERLPPDYLQALATPAAEPGPSGELERVRAECATKAAALEQAQGKLAKTVAQLDDLKAAHEELATRHGDLHRKHAACTSVEDALFDERERMKTTVAKADERADFARIERGAARGHLRALLEQILGEPVDGRVSAEHLDDLITRAGLLVAAAVEQIDAKFAAGVHVCRYPVEDDPNNPLPCDCGKKFPRPKGRR